MRALKLSYKGNNFRGATQNQGTNMYTYSAVFCVSTTRQ